MPFYGKNTKSECLLSITAGGSYPQNGGKNKDAGLDLGSASLERGVFEDDWSARNKLLREVPGVEHQNGHVGAQTAILRGLSTDLAVLVDRGMAMLDSPVKPANDGRKQ